MSAAENWHDQLVCSQWREFVAAQVNSFLRSNIPFTFELPSPEAIRPSHVADMPSYERYTEEEVVTLMEAMYTYNNQKKQLEMGSVKNGTRMSLLQLLLEMMRAMLVKDPSTGRPHTYQVLAPQIGRVKGLISRELMGKVSRQLMAARYFYLIMQPFAELDAFEPGTWHNQKILKSKVLADLLQAVDQCLELAKSSEAIRTCHEATHLATGARPEATAEQEVSMTPAVPQETDTPSTSEIALKHNMPSEESAERMSLSHEALPRREMSLALCRKEEEEHGRQELEQRQGPVLGDEFHRPIGENLAEGSAKEKEAYDTLCKDIKEILEKILGKEG